MKTFQTRAIPLLLGIALGMAISWVSIYLFWFAIWTFHSVPMARFIAGIGTVILFPAQWITEFTGGDQSTVLYDPVSYAGTNGLVIGIILYCIFRAWLKRHERAKEMHQAAAAPRRVEARVG